MSADADTVQEALERLARRKGGSAAAFAALSRLAAAEVAVAAFADWLDKPHRVERWHLVVSLLGPEWADVANVGELLADCRAALSEAQAHRDTLIKAAHNAQTWIENYPLNVSAGFAADWAAVRDELAAALAAVAPAEAKP